MFCRVMDEEEAIELLQAGRCEVLAGRLEAALDQRAGAGADHVAGLFEGQRAQSLPEQDDVEGPDEITRGVCQGAIEIEDDDRGKVRCHGFLATQKTGMNQGMRC